MDETPGQRVEARRIALVPKMTKVALAKRAHINRVTLDRAIADDPTVKPATWAAIEEALDDAEDEAEQAEAGTLATTIEFMGATITIRGTPLLTAETALRIIQGRSD